MSLRKSSRSRKGSKSEVLPKPKARRRWTPAPSRVGLDLIKRLIGRNDICRPFNELWNPKPVEPRLSSRLRAGTEQSTTKKQIVKGWRFRDRTVLLLFEFLAGSGNAGQADAVIGAAL